MIWVAGNWLRTWWLAWQKKSSGSHLPDWPLPFTGQVTFVRFYNKPVKIPERSQPAKARIWCYLCQFQGVFPNEIAHNQQRRGSHTSSHSHMKMIDSNGICRIVVVSPFAALCCSVVLSVVPSTGWLGLIMTALLETVVPTVILHRIFFSFLLHQEVFVKWKFPTLNKFTQITVYIIFA